MKVHADRFTYKGRVFTIAERDEDGILVAIENKYIDKNGRLTKSLNGFNLLADRRRNTIPEIIERIYETVDYEEFMEDAAPQSIQEKVELTAYFFQARYSRA